MFKGEKTRWMGVNYGFLFPRISILVFPNNRGNPQIIHFNRVFRFSIINHPFWGYPYFWKQPYNSMIHTREIIRSHPVSSPVVFFRRRRSTSAPKRNACVSRRGLDGKKRRVDVLPES